ncbi:SDR family NAD(P)-dependent oxidoreductase [Thalassolituus marinus]|uniref:SDR family NAD(P)-dependent oxidoreductase n=1 Tax=Thalassolituus marinus TaxID=671053 RepID=A0ABS7ZMD7_9GAMM|nr:SDR family NAD(P)-dependent oxidoreductase [Thalassolituus marinus]MCA6062879.1 SDR family NAD(P)-dependent oxidoreductase [Thalassolituus marinus]
MQRVLVAGSGGGIGEALVHGLRQAGYSVFTLSRTGTPSSEHCVADLSSAAAVNSIRTFLASVQPDVVFCCAGVLHDGQHGPEKNVGSISDDWLLHSMRVNVLPHVHLAQALAPLLNRSASVKWISLSAMVGSISDNRLGGWYSYRMSKAALNMFIRNLAIEWERKAPASVVVAQHPGTTDSALSQPFQAGIADGRLYTVAQTASRLIAVMQALSPQQHGKLLHWDGSVIPF